MELLSSFSTDFIEALRTIGDLAAKIESGVGVVVLLFSLIFLIFNRRIIKVLYFFSGLAILTILPLIIGIAIIIFTKEVKNVEPKQFHILSGCSIAIGLIADSLAAWNCMIGILMIGGLAGLCLWSIIGQFINNQLVNLICYLFAIVIMAVACGYFKKPAEIIASAIIGGKCFGTGFKLFFYGTAALIIGNDYTKLAKLFFISMITALVLQVVATLISGTYYLVKYARSKEEPQMGPVDTKIQSIA